MNLLDIFIIYLACGAPFGVYYFLQNRSQSSSISFWLKLLFNFIFWIPFALKVFRQQNNFNSHRVFGFDKTPAADSIQAKNLQTLQKQIAKTLAESNLPISIYEFRETFERYIGLTLAARIDDESISEQEKELFRVAEMKNFELGAICLRRRNRKRLFIHQTEARKDFLHLVNQLIESGCGKDKLRQSTIEIVKILRDIEAQNVLERVFAISPQTGNRLNVPKSENDIWKPELQIPFPVKPISPRIQAMQATANLRKKD